MATGSKERLTEILNQDEYQIYYEDNRSLIQRVKDWFQDLLAQLLEKLFPALESTTNIAGIIITLLVVAIVIVLGVVLYRVARNRRLKKHYEQASPFTALHEMDWTFQNHFDTAEEKEEQQAYEEAIRHLFLALLLYFDEIDWVKAKIWKTNWEYYAELNKVNKAGAKSFNQLARLFDHVTYGKYTVSFTEYKQYKDTVLTAYERAKEQINREEEE